MYVYVSVCAYVYGYVSYFLHWGHSAVPALRLSMHLFWTVVDFVWLKKISLQKKKSCLLSDIPLIPMAGSNWPIRDTFVTFYYTHKEIIELTQICFCVLCAQMRQNPIKKTHFFHQFYSFPGPGQIDPWGTLLLLFFYTNFNSSNPLKNNCACSRWKCDTTINALFLIDQNQFRVVLTQGTD